MAQIAAATVHKFVRHKTLLIPSHKGGVGKSTSSAQIAYGLAQFGLTVLIVDLDANGGVTALTGANDSVGNNVRSFLEGTASGSECVQAPEDWQPVAGESVTSGGPFVDGGAVHIIPSGPEVADSINLPGSEAELRLRNNLAKDDFGDSYDVIILDVLGGETPTLSLALHAAEHVIFPLVPESLEFRGFSMVIQKIIRFATPHTELTNINAIGSIVPRFHRGRAIHREVMNYAKRHLAETVPGALWIAPPVPDRVVVKDAALEQRPIMTMNAWADTETGRSRVMEVAAAYTSISLSVAGAMVGDEFYDHMHELIMSSELPSSGKQMLQDGLEATLPMYESSDDENEE